MEDHRASAREAPLPKLLTETSHDTLDETLANGQVVFEWAGFDPGPCRLFQCDHLRHGDGLATYRIGKPFDRDGFSLAVSGALEDEVVCLERPKACAFYTFRG